MVNYFSTHDIQPPVVYHTTQRTMTEESFKDKLIETLSKPALDGVIGALIAGVALGETGSVFIFGKEINGPLAIGATITGASYLGEVAHQWILPEIPKNDKFATFEGMIISPVVCGAATYGLMKVASNRPVGDPVPLTYFALGAGSSILGQYSYDTVKKNLIDQL